ncbi:hypothetical protein GCM10025857_36970 [Alicyclobacillus contaminans]|nr:hypothetical protein GCM10025857_36970 [Alicyclobacillus contaminans]
MNAVEVAPDASAEAFGAWLGDKLTVPSRLLWPCGQRARSEFAEELSARGHSVHPLVCYNTVERAVDRAAWKRWMEAVDRIHVLMFYSPSAVASWRRQPMVEAVSAQVRLAAVGKTTAAALAAGGLPVWCVSTQPDDEAFVETIADCWQRSFTCKETEGESS